MYMNNHILLFWIQTMVNNLSWSSARSIISVTPKVPEHMRTCQCCNSNQIENEFHFLLMCNCYNAIRKIFMDDITSKYPSFVSLDDHHKIIFLFNSIDPFICRKLGYFIYEAFELRNKSTNLRITKPST